MASNDFHLQSFTDKNIGMLEHCNYFLLFSSINVQQHSTFVPYYIMKTDFVLVDV